MKKPEERLNMKKNCPICNSTTFKPYYSLETGHILGKACQRCGYKNLIKEKSKSKEIIKQSGGFSSQESQS